MYTEEQMNKILAQVEVEFDSLLNKAEETANETIEETEVELNTEKTEEVEAVEAAADDVEEVVVAEKSEDSETKIEKEEDSHDYSDDDVKEVEELYSSMNKSEAEIHYKAVKKAMGGAISEEAEEAVEEKAIKKIAKSEKVEVEETEDMKKAEEKIKELAEENEKLQKSIGDLTSALSKIFKAKPAPQRKVVTGLNYQTIAKTEGGEEDVTLSKAEIDSKLDKAAASYSTQKEDRELINNYYLKNGSLDSIKHLLK